jgi:FemAB-related protein (PEP-CTERM system-associated)
MTPASVATSSLLAPLTLPSVSPQISVTDDPSEREWNAFIERHPDATPDHQWQWRQVFENVFSQKCAYLAARRGDEVIGVLPLVLFRSMLFGRFAVSVPYLNYGGLLATDAQAVGPLVARATEIAKEFGASHIELRHQRRELSAHPSREHKVRMTLGLPATSAELWSRLDRKVRNQIRKAQKESLTTLSGGSELVDEFYGVFAENMRDLGTPVYSIELFRETTRVFSDRCRIHVVRRGDQCLAASVTVRFRDLVIVPWASSTRQYRHLCPNMLLYWSMLERSIETGAASFDFGRSTRGAGTHLFKAQWGASETVLHWEYVLINRESAPDQGTGNRKLAAATKAWKRLPLGVANRLGPWIVGNIP